MSVTVPPPPIPINMLLGGQCSSNMVNMVPTASGLKRNVHQGMSSIPACWCFHLTRTGQYVRRHAHRHSTHAQRCTEHACIQSFKGYSHTYIHPHLPQNTHKQNSTQHTPTHRHRHTDTDTHIRTPLTFPGGGNPETPLVVAMSSWELRLFNTANKVVTSYSLHQQHKSQKLI